MQLYCEQKYRTDNHPYFYLNRQDMLLNFISVILIYALCLSFQEVQASSLGSINLQNPETFPNKDIHKNNVKLPNRIRSESTDGIIPFVLRNSGLGNNEMKTLLRKISLKCIPEIIEYYQKNNSINPERYLLYATGIGGIKRNAIFSYSFPLHYNNKPSKIEFMEGFEESCIFNGGCRIRIVVRTINTSKRLIIEKVVEKMRNSAQLTLFLNPKYKLSFRVRRSTSISTYIVDVMVKSRLCNSNNILFRWEQHGAYRPDGSLADHLLRRTVSMQPSLDPVSVPVKEDLNSAIFGQDTVLKLHKYMTDNNLGAFESNINISSVQIDSLKTNEYFNATISNLSFLENETEEGGGPLKEIIHKQEGIPSKRKCRKIGCGIVATIQTNQAIKDKLVNDWISDLNLPHLNFKKVFNLNSKQLSIKSFEDRKNKMMNSKYKYTVILFLPYKIKQLKQPTK